MRAQQQNKDVLKHLQSHNFITPNIAREQYAIERVASVVHRLKNGRLGGVKYYITTEIMNGLNRFKKPCTYARYKLIK